MKRPRPPEGEYQTVPPEAERPRPHEEKPEEEILEVKKSPEGRPDIEVAFLYVIHGPEYADQIWEKIKDADLILCEVTGGTGRQRKFDALKWQALFFVAEKAPDILPIRWLKERLCQADTCYERILGKALGTQKRVEFIDVAKEDPGYTEMEARDEIGIRIGVLVENGEVDEALKLYPAYIEKGTAVLELREDTVVNQLKEKFGRVKGKARITVIQGGIHTLTYHMMRQAALPLHMRYAFFPTPFSYYLGDTLVRRKRFFPEREIAEEEYRRAFVGDRLIRRGAAIIWPEASPHERCAFTNELSSRLTEAEITESLERFSQEQKALASAIRKRYPKEVIIKAGIPLYITATVVKELAEKHGITIKTEAEEPSEKVS